MARPIKPFGELKKAYEDKRTNPETTAILNEARDKLLALPKV